LRLDPPRSSVKRGENSGGKPVTKVI
jgi:hypothetical protein